MLNFTETPHWYMHKMYTGVTTIRSRPNYSMYMVRAFEIDLDRKKFDVYNMHVYETERFSNNAFTFTLK